MKTETELTTNETNRLAECEAVIERTRSSFVEFGRALATIRDERLYRQTHGTFEAYCQERWGYTRQRAYTLMSASEAAQNVNTRVDIPVSQRAAIALSQVPEDQQEEVARAAQATGKVTARSVKEAAARQKPADVVLDKTGTPIPPAIQEEWNRAEQWQEWLTTMSRLKVALESALENSDLAVSEISNITVARVTDTYNDLKCIIPYAVCWTCGGHKPKRCAVCKGRGFVSRFRFDSVAPSEVKELRRRAKR